MMVSLQKIFRHLLFLPAYFRHSNVNSSTFLLTSGTFIILLLASCGNSDKEVNEYNSKSLGVEEITNAMNQLAFDKNLRQNLIEKGRIQRTKFSWGKTAAIIYDNILKTVQDEKHSK